MNTPKITQCPGCGEKPEPARGENGVLGLWCDSCGFSASLTDIFQAEYLLRFYPKLNIRVAAERIARRVPIGHGLAKAA